MNGKTYLYILVCAAVSFLIRELPLTLIRRPIKSRFLRSFLFYVPYVTLAVMTFPSIVNATSSPIAGLAALVLGIAAAWPAQICFRSPSAAARSCWYWSFS